MTEALKTDWLEQAKREIAEEHIGRPLGDLYNALIAERARNLELRAMIRLLCDDDVSLEYCRRLAKRTFAKKESVSHERD